jgi:hypothetical protein
MFDEFLAKRKREEAPAEPAADFPPVPPDITPMDWCLGVIQGRYQWDPHKFRAAQAVLPYTVPKLAAVVVAHAGGDFADRLSAARMDHKRWAAEQAGGLKTIEHVPAEPDPPAPRPVNYNAPFAPLRRF